MPSSDEFRTDDMALAAALATDDLPYKVIRLPGDRHRVEWVFTLNGNNGHVMELVRDYHDDGLMVEAKKFMKCYADVRGDMYRLLGISKRSAA